MKDRTVAMGTVADFLEGSEGIGASEPVGHEHMPRRWC
jgi:hypothetical protein